jgi:stage V sporulation protein AF
MNHTTQHEGDTEAVQHPPTGESGHVEDAEARKRHQEKVENEISNNVKESVLYWQEEDTIPARMEDIKQTLQDTVGLGKSFDVILREMKFGGRKVGIFFINGFANSLLLSEVLDRLSYVTARDISSNALQSYFECFIPHVQVELEDKMSAVINKVLTGVSAFFIDGEHKAILVDTRSYPVRGPEEPTIEKVVRGARDGFTETLMTNISLVRRRLRDPGLKYEVMQVGRRTRTDVCLAYIDDIADKKLVDSVRDKVKQIVIDGIPLADKQLEEAMTDKKWNPYPLVRYSERPDVVASHLLEGRVVLFVDTSPSVMILPTTFFDLCQHAEENRQSPFMGSYLRWIRFAGIFASLFLLPLWMLMVISPELKPPMFDFIGPQKAAKLPLILQFLLIEFGVDLMRMAAVHTPTPLASAMGLIAAILIGDIAVQTGLFVNEVVLYMAIAAIGMFATPSYELGLANRLIRLVLLVLVAAFKIKGFVIGVTAILVLLTVHRSYNSSYMWPFIPFSAKGMLSILVRKSVMEDERRPSYNKPRDSTRMPEHQGGT